MTPQEQIEELKKAVNKLADLSVYLCEEVYDEPDGEKITDAVARFEDWRDLVLRSIRFDSPQISEGITVRLDRGTAEYLLLVGTDEQSGEYFSDTYQGKVMPALRAALTQKGDSNE